MGLTVLAALPAQCLYYPSAFENVEAKYNAPYVAVSLAFLAISYLTRIVQLFPALSIMVRTSLRTRPSNVLKQVIRVTGERKRNSTHRCARMLFAAAEILVMSIYYRLKGAADFYSSVLWEVSLTMRLFCYSANILDNLAMCCPHLGCITSLHRSTVSSCWLCQRRCRERECLGV